MSSVSTLRQEEAAQRSWVIAVIEDHDLAVVALFCAIGLTASIGLLHYFPDLGAIIAQLN